MRSAGPSLLYLAWSWIRIRRPLLVCEYILWLNCEASRELEDLDSILNLRLIKHLPSLGLDCHIIWGYSHTSRSKITKRVFFLHVLLLLISSLGVDAWSSCSVGPVVAPALDIRKHIKWLILWLFSTIVCYRMYFLLLWLKVVKVKYKFV